MPLERQRAAEDRQRQAALEEQGRQAPASDAAAVLEHSLGGEVTALHALVQRVGLGEPRLRIAFTVLDGGLRSRLVVHHEVHGQPGAVRPLGIRRIRSIPDEIAVVASHHEFRLLVMSALPRSATAQPGRSERVRAWGPYRGPQDRKSTRLNSSHRCISYAVFCLKKKKKRQKRIIKR